MRLFVAALLMTLPIAATAQLRPAQPAAVPAPAAPSLSPAGRATMEAAQKAGMERLRSILQRRGPQLRAAQIDLADALAATPFDAAKAQRAITTQQALTSEITNVVASAQLDGLKKLSAADRMLLSRQFRASADRIAKEGFSPPAPR
ncbi:MAG: hypothetical protein RQ833_08065 [Sphingomonadaceae bacterium]|nr:hypothetical protein [Sphingomonadaceae bacterium]